MAFNLRIKKSTIAGAGKGLFADSVMSKGALLRVDGIVIERDSIEDVCTRFADPYKFRIGTRLLIPTGYAGMVNHSLKPNLEKVIEGKNLYLRATRLISAGEELFFTYNPYAQRQFKKS